MNISPPKLVSITLPDYAWRAMLDPLKNERLDARRSGFNVLSKCYHDAIEAIEAEFPAPPRETPP